MSFEFSKPKKQPEQETVLSRRGFLTGAAAIATLSALPGSAVADGLTDLKDELDAACVHSEASKSIENLFNKGEEDVEKSSSFSFEVSGQMAHYFGNEEKGYLVWEFPAHTEISSPVAGVIVKISENAKSAYGDTSAIYIKDVNGNYVYPLCT